MTARTAKPAPGLEDLRARWADIRSERSALTASRETCAHELEKAIAAGADRETRDAIRAELQDLDDQLTANDMAGDAAVQALTAEERREKNAEIERLEATSEQATNELAAARDRLRELERSVFAQLSSALDAIHDAGQAANRADHAAKLARGEKYEPANQPYRGSDMVTIDDICHRMTSRARGVTR